MKKVTLKRAGGYDPALGPKHPSNRDPSLETVARSISDDMQRDFDHAIGSGLPAITIAIVKIGELTKAHRVTMTIPRGTDPRSWAIAHRACAELCLSAGRGSQHSPPSWPEHAPDIERGKQNTCLVVVVRCRDANEAADVVEVVERVANVVARDPIGRLSHRVVRA